MTVFVNLIEKSGISPVLPVFSPNLKPDHIINPYNTLPMARVDLDTGFLEQYQQFVLPHASVLIAWSYIESLSTMRKNMYIESLFPCRSSLVGSALSLIPQENTWQHQARQSSLSQNRSVQTSDLYPSEP